MNHPISVPQAAKVAPAVGCEVSADLLALAALLDVPFTNATTAPALLTEILHKAEVRLPEGAPDDNDR